MKKHTKRRKRRRANAIVKYGKSAVRKHMKRGGRTGRIREKATPRSKVIYKSVRPNPPGPHSLDLG